jgi:putative transposase
LKEFGYIPVNANVKSCTVSEKVGRYYISVLFEEEASPEAYIKSDGIGIDLGIKEFATISNNQTFGNINKGKIIRELPKYSCTRGKRRVAKRKASDYN